MTIALDLAPPRDLDADTRAPRTPVFVERRRQPRVATTCPVARDVSLPTAWLAVPPAPAAAGIPPARDAAPAEEAVRGAWLDRLDRLEAAIDRCLPRSVDRLLQSAICVSAAMAVLSLLLPLVDGR